MWWLLAVRGPGTCQCCPVGTVLPLRTIASGAVAWGLHAGVCALASMGPLRSTAVPPATVTQSEQEHAGESSFSGGEGTVWNLTAQSRTTSQPRLFLSSLSYNHHTLRM